MDNQEADTACLRESDLPLCGQGVATVQVSMLDLTEYGKKYGIYV